MNIYFTAAISQKDKYSKYYSEIVDTLIKCGHKVIHEHISDIDMSDLEKSSNSKQEDYYKKVTAWIGKADVVVAEVSFPSTLNIGHEITTALDKHKPVIALYLEGKESIFFSGIKSDNLLYCEYTDKTLPTVLKTAINQISNIADTRFNFYISPEIGRYLDWVSQNRKLPRAVFLRSLLEKAMKVEKDFEP